jgi:hypothetical protein
MLSAGIAITARNDGDLLDDTLRDLAVNVLKTTESIWLPLLLVMNGYRAVPRAQEGKQNQKTPRITRIQKRFGDMWNLLRICYS